MIALTRILKNDVKRNTQEVIATIVTGSEFSGFFYYLYMNKYDGRIRLEMITGNSIIPSNQIELLKANAKSIKAFLDKAIIQFNIGNIDISKYPIIKQLINDVYVKFGKPLKLVDINEPWILAEKYRAFK
ncbi:MAG: hypothetical protein ACLT40_09425 [Fusobacterium sp.]